MQSADSEAAAMEEGAELTDGARACLSHVASQKLILAHNFMCVAEMERAIALRRERS